jgi:hypothetical protein
MNNRILGARMINDSSQAKILQSALYFQTKCMTRLFRKSIFDRKFLKDIMKKIGGLLMTLAATFMAGCAVPTTGVVPQGDEMYAITRQGNSFLVTTDTLKTAALQEADTYCAHQNKKLKFIHSKEIPAAAFGRWPESEVLFKCE